MKRLNKNSKSTSWGGVAKWYDDLIEKEASSYQKEVILPNVLRLLAPKQGERILDLACGQGFFSREFAKLGADVIGVDIAPELIKIASVNSESKTNIRIKPEFRVSSADKLDFIPDGSIDKVAIILALQNIEDINGVFKECARILSSKGKIVLVINHPAFRIPKTSSWEFAEKEKIQYRRIDKYMSESSVQIQMHPGKDPKDVTISFHRPLQVYFKAIKKTGFAVTGLEEWISNKESEQGPRARAEDEARKEIPLFLSLEVVKI